jgi:putative endonuclease
MILVYVIRSQTNGKCYVGITNDLERRLAEHRRHKSSAGHLLGEIELLWTESFPDYTQARQREKVLKSGQGRKWSDEKFGRCMSRPAGGGSSLPA